MYFSPPANPCALLPTCSHTLFICLHRFPLKYFVLYDTWGALNSPAEVGRAVQATPAGEVDLTGGLISELVWHCAVITKSHLQHLKKCREKRSWAREKKQGRKRARSVWNRACEEGREGQRPSRKETEWVREGEKEEGGYIRLPLKLGMLLVLEPGPVV